MARYSFIFFSVLPDNRRIFIWRKDGTSNNLAFMHRSVRFGGEGVMIYASISIDGRTNIHITQNGALTGRRYGDEILLHVFPYAAAIEDYFILIDDNCMSHGANLVGDCCGGGSGAIMGSVSEFAWETDYCMSWWSDDSSSWLYTVALSALRNAPEDGELKPVEQKNKRAVGVEHALSLTVSEMKCPIRLALTTIPRSKSVN